MVLKENCRFRVDKRAGFNQLGYESLQLPSAPNEDRVWKFRFACAYECHSSRCALCVGFSTPSPNFFY